MFSTIGHVLVIHFPADEAGAILKAYLEQQARKQQAVAARPHQEPTARLTYALDQLQAYLEQQARKLQRRQ